jgi:hypothetical protein
VSSERKKKLKLTYIISVPLKRFIYFPVLAEVCFLTDATLLRFSIGCMFFSSIHL